MGSGISITPTYDDNNDFNRESDSLLSYTNYIKKIEEQRMKGDDIMIESSIGICTDSQDAATVSGQRKSSDLPVSDDMISNAKNEERPGSSKNFDQRAFRRNTRSVSLTDLWEGPMDPESLLKMPPPKLPLSSQYRQHHDLLFIGLDGSGKTSLVNILAMKCIPNGKLLVPPPPTYEPYRIICRNDKYLFSVIDTPGKSFERQGWFGSFPHVISDYYLNYRNNYSKYLHLLKEKANFQNQEDSESFVSEEYSHQIVSTDQKIKEKSKDCELSDFRELSTKGLAEGAKASEHVDGNIIISSTAGENSKLPSINNDTDIENHKPFDTLSDKIKMEERVMDPNLGENNVNGIHQIPTEEALQHKPFCLVFVVDSTDRLRFPIIRQHFIHLSNISILEDVTILIIATKQDLPKARPLTSIRDELGVNKYLRNRKRMLNIVGASAFSSKGVFEAMDWVLKLKG